MNQQLKEALDKLINDNIKVVDRDGNEPIINPIVLVFGEPTDSFESAESAVHAADWWKSHLRGFTARILKLSKELDKS